MRWYYDDALAAAWMAKHFEMKFEAPDDGPPLDLLGVILCADMGMERFDIHPDSLYLLEPQDGDLVSINDGESAALIKGDGFLETFKAMRPQFYKSETIIQRNGIPFMWPQQKAENASL